MSEDPISQDREMVVVTGAYVGKLGECRGEEIDVGSGVTHVTRLKRRASLSEAVIQRGFSNRIFTLLDYLPTICRAVRVSRWSGSSSLRHVI